MALRNATPVNGGFGPERVDRVPSATMAANSTSTALTKASTSLKASQEAGEVLAGVKAVPIGCADPVAIYDDRRHTLPLSRASALFQLKVAFRPAQGGTPRLRTSYQICVRISSEFELLSCC
jgi:hypothetical protein